MMTFPGHKHRSPSLKGVCRDNRLLLGASRVGVRVQWRPQCSLEDVRGRMHFSALLALTFVVALVIATEIVSVKSHGFIPLPYEEQESTDSTYVIGEVIANEFDRHVPALSDNLRGELNLLRNDITRQFDSLKHHMDTKLDRMQRDAPEGSFSVEEKHIEDSPAARTPGATIRHNLAMAELRRLGADLTQAMNEEVNKLRQEFRSSLDQLRVQMQNSTESLASRLQSEFVAQSEESTTMLKKVFYLTRNQMAVIQNQLGNITSTLQGEGQELSQLPPQQPVVEQPSQQALVQESLQETATDAVQSLSDNSLSNELPGTTTTTTVPTTTLEPENLPRDCHEALLEGRDRSGLFTIRPNGDMNPKRVWCEQEVDGGGWTMMLWRKAQKVQLDFRQPWQRYSEGFGQPDGEHWIGLETLYRLTKGNPYSLRVDMTWEDESATSLYDYFSVGPSRYGRRGYELNVGGYNKSSTGGDAMEYHNGMDFSTYDEDNDGASGGSCSEWSGGGGWWYNFCFYSNPTGVYPPADLPPSTQADHLLEWRKWQGYYTYLSSLRMMIRPP